MPSLKMWQSLFVPFTTRSILSAILFEYMLRRWVFENLDLYLRGVF